MSSIGSGYDLYTTSYSPDGRIFQVEYANKAVENSGTAIGIKVKDGVVLAVEKMLVSKLLVEGSNSRIHTLDRQAGMAVAGLAADARAIAEQAVGDAADFKRNYGQAMPPQILSERIAFFLHAYTQYWSVRPFGAAGLIAAATNEDKKEGKEGGGKTAELWLVEPNGSCYRYFGTAIGKGRQAAKVEIEKLDLKNMTARQAVTELARIIYAIHDEVKDKDFELEMSWVCEESQYLHQTVPKQIKEEAEAAAKAALAREMEE